MAPVDLHLLSHDGQLALRADSRAAGVLREWLPVWARRQPAGIGHPLAEIELLVNPAPAQAGLAPPIPEGDRLFALGTVRAAEATTPGAILLTGAAGTGSAGMLQLREHRASLTVPGDQHGGLSSAAQADLYTMLTIASALLLGRLHRALVHSAAAIDPEGRAWLLVGDSQAGKTSTCATLIQGGWRYTSDDHVVLVQAGAVITVDGWPRQFHLDQGWERRTPTGRRDTVDPTQRWPNRWVSSAPLAGVLFPQVAAHEPTEMSPVSQAEAFGRIVRQSPWLFADRDVAPNVMELLAHVAKHPAFALRVGLDSYGVPERLCSTIARATSPSATTTSTAPARTAS